MTRFAGKVAIVTGGGMGMGRAIARRLAGEGAEVAIFDRDMAAAGESVGTIEGDGGVAVAFAADISKPEAVSEAVAATVARFGRLDVLANNAGFMHPRDDLFGMLDDEAWHATLAVNLHGPFACMHAALPHLRVRGGAIVTSASNAGVTGTGRPAYGTSKAAAIALTLAVARAHAADGVRANIVLPGAFATPMLETVRTYPMSAAHPKYRALPYIAEAHEIAGVVAFLASDDAASINGAIFPVDGGSLAA